MTTAAGLRGPLPPMPQRTPKTLRAAIEQHTPKLLPDFDRDRNQKIAETYEVSRCLPS